MITELKETIILTASYYDRTISAALLNMYVEDLEDLNPAAVIAAYRHWRRNPKNTTFPLPAQIRAMIHPEVDPDSAARALAERIVGAIPKFGWNNSTEARAYIGEIGWQIVRRQGGWENLCGVDGPRLNPQTLQAQLRDAAKAALMYPQETIERAIGIGEAPKTGELQSARDIMKLITDTGTP